LSKKEQQFEKNKLRVIAFCEGQITGIINKLVPNTRPKVIAVRCPFNGSKKS
jgi:hypothetical protein